MQCVTAVDPEWLAELGPMFFSIKVPQSLTTFGRVAVLTASLGTLDFSSLANPPIFLLKPALLVLTLQEGNSARLDQRKKEAMHKEAMEGEMRTMTELRAKQLEDAEKKKSEQRAKERSAIATPGRRLQTPTRTPGRRIGL